MTPTTHVSFETIALNRIDESPTNPRKTFSGVEELAEDIRIRGILQPVLVRPKRSRYELVFGAKRLRAAAMAGLDSVPAMVRDIDDAEVIEIQIIENAKRSDVHPIEEADAIRVLHEVHHYTVEQLAAKLGKSTTLVHRRLKLSTICEEGRRALLDGQLTLAAAEMLARVPSAHQPKAVEELASWGNQSAGSVAEYIERNFLLLLEEAPFSLEDASLTVAGACVTCPKRTGTQPSLFDDITRDDCCTDRACFDAKVDALLAKRREEGHTVLEGKEAEAVAPYGRISFQSDLVSLDDEVCEADERPENRTWRDVLGNDAPPTTLVRVGNKVIEAIDRDALKVAVEQRAPELLDANEYELRPAANPVAQGGNASVEEWREKERRKKELESRFASLAQCALADAGQAGGLTTEVVRIIAVGLVRESWAEHLNRIAKRRGIEGKDAKRSLVAEIATMGDSELAGFLVEVACIRAARLGTEDPFYDGGPSFQQICRELNIDFDALKKQAKKDVSSKRAPKAKKGKAS